MLTDIQLSIKWKWHLLFHDNVLLSSCSFSISLPLSPTNERAHTHCLATLMLMTFSEEKQRFVDVETFCELLNLVLGSQFRAQVDLITEYLKVGFYYFWTKSQNTFCWSNICFMICFVICMGLIFWQLQSDYQMLSMDQWVNFYRFCRDVSNCFWHNFLHYFFLYWSLGQLKPWKKGIKLKLHWICYIINHAYPNKTSVSWCP